MHVLHLKRETRLQFSLSKSVKLHVFALKNPRRLVLDFKKTHLAHKLALKKLSATPIKKVRAGVRKGHDLRVVLDLRRQVSYQLKQVHLSSGGALFQLRLFDRSSKKPKALKKPEKKPVKKPVRGRDIIVVIDPGHGGKDPGAIGGRGTQEKRVVLAIARDLRRELNRQPGFKAVLTRYDDRYIGLRQRLNLARRQHADMFVAIHADAYRHRSAHGASVYALSRRGATSEAARWLAHRENDSELMGGADLNDKNSMLRSVLINLSQIATVRASVNIGRNVLMHVANFASLHHDQVEQAAFVVLKSPDIPSILVECGFLSNRAEERLLRRSDYQRDLARAIAKGIVGYFQKRPPRGSWLAVHH